jgi:hypothetical protein
MTRKDHSYVPLGITFHDALICVGVRTLFTNQYLKMRFSQTSALTIYTYVSPFTHAAKLEANMKLEHYGHGSDKIHFRDIGHE